MEQYYSNIIKKIVNNWRLHYTEKLMRHFVFLALISSFTAFNWLALMLFCIIVYLSSVSSWEIKPPGINSMDWCSRKHTFEICFLSKKIIYRQGMIIPPPLRHINGHGVRLGSGIPVISLWNKQCTKINTPIIMFYNLIIYRCYIKEK